MIRRPRIARRPAAQAPGALGFGPAVAAGWAGRRDDRRVTLLLPAAALLAPLLALALSLWLGWGAAWRDATADLRRAAAATAAYNERALGGYALATGRVNDALRALSDAEIAANERDLHDRLARLLAGLAGAESTYVTNRTGAAIVSADMFPVSQDAAAAGSDLFRALSSSAPPDVYVSEVFLSSRDSKPYFAVGRVRADTGNARPDDQPVGPFDGLVYIAVWPELLGAEMRRMSGGAHDVLSLLRPDGALLVRSTGFMTPPPRLAADAPFHRVVASEAAAVETTMPDPASGEEALVALRRLSGFPLYAVAARPVAEITAAWLDAQTPQLLFALPATLGLFLLAMAARRGHIRLRVANSGLEAMAAERATALIDVAEALDLSPSMVLLPSGVIHHWSLGCARLYGYSRVEAEGMLAADLLATEFPDGGADAVLAALAAHGQWRGELRQTHKSGARLAVWSYWLAHVAPRGEQVRFVVHATDLGPLRQLAGRRDAPDEPPPGA